MSRRPRDAEATRKSILDAAERLFVEKGFGSTSMASIGKICGCANSLIVHHFGSKEALWKQVKERAFSGFVEESQRIFRDKPVSIESMRETTETYFRLLQNNPRLVMLLSRAEMERDTGSGMNTDQLDPFVDRMRAAQEAGILRRDIPPAHILLALIHMITRWFEARHLFSGWDALGEEDIDERYLESVHKLILEGALSPATREAMA